MLKSPCPLERLLLKAHPDFAVDDTDEYGKPCQRLSVAEFAEFYGMSKEGVYKWLRKKRISPTSAGMIVSNSRGRVQKKDFLPFFFA